MVLLSDLKVRAGAFDIAGVNIEIPKGKCAVLKGKSGSGKTTIMEAICGLRDVISGSIEIDGRDVTYATPADRNVGLVPQDNVLFRTMTVREHLAYGLKLRKWEKANILERVENLAGSLQIEHLLERKPRGLSGGEAKRVAIGRAMASRPDLLCLDESFTGLDDETREDVMTVVKTAIQDEGLTTLMITHQKEEAAFMGDWALPVNGQWAMVNCRGR